MSMSEKKNSNLVLPPHVSGKLNGFLDLVIKEIIWTTTKKFREVEIKLLWWGQSEGEFRKFISGANSKSCLTIRYQVHTNYRLLQNYLRNCESITMQIFSIKNKNLIGCSCIPISSNLQNFKDPVQNLKITSSILSPRMFKIGELVASVRINNQSISNDSENIKRVSFKEQSRIKESASNKENIKIIGIKKQILSRVAKSVTANNSRLMTAPLKSDNVLIKSSFSYNIKNEFDPNYNLADSIKLAIVAVEFNAIGIALLESFIAPLSDKKCILKCAVSPKIFKTIPSEDSKMFSYTFDTPRESK